MAATAQNGPGGAKAPPGAKPMSIANLLFRIVALALIDAITIWLVYQMVGDGILAASDCPRASLPSGYQHRFLAGSFIRCAGVARPVAHGDHGAYPFIFTFYISFTNYGDGHLVTTQQIIRADRERRPICRPMPNLQVDGLQESCRRVHVVDGSQT